MESMQAGLRQAAGAAAGNDEGVLWLVYDGQCPLCTNYCRFVRLGQLAGRLVLVDARQPGPLMDEITALGLDIDQGMVVKFKGAIYYGADAIYILTALSTRSGLFNRVAYWVFGTRTGARLLYPLCKAVRNLVLKLVGVPYIGNLTRSDQVR